MNDVREHLTKELPDAEATYEFGRALGAVLQAGDLVIMSGDLGAGKTTMTRGIGQALKVRGDVTSPTFVIAREHPSLVHGPSLVHVDAYRLGDLDELDGLDLETSLEEAVTVVEWGSGVAESLADDRLHLTLTDVVTHGRDSRQVVVTSVGSRWQNVDLGTALRTDE